MKVKSEQLWTTIIERIPVIYTINDRVSAAALISNLHMGGAALIWAAALIRERHLELLNLG